MQSESINSTVKKGYYCWHWLLKHATEDQGACRLILSGASSGLLAVLLVQAMDVPASVWNADARRLCKL
jgi:hypothetical protein